MKKFSIFVTVAFIEICICNLAFADFYVIAGGGRIGTCITSLPYTISSPGFYYIKGNLESTETGITVNADNVTLDLMGFTITGPGKDSGTGHGIYISAEYNVEIRNGTVRDFGLNGVYEYSAVNSHRIMSVRSVSNGGDGINLQGLGHLVKNCTSSRNGGKGINVDRATTVVGNTCYDNEDDGIHTGHGCTVIGNTSMSNGADGIDVPSGCTVKNNTTWYNENFGIAVSSFCLLDGNTAFQNNLSDGGYANIETCGTCTFGFNEN